MSKANSYAESCRLARELLLKSWDVADITWESLATWESYEYREYANGTVLIKTPETFVTWQDVSESWLQADHDWELVRGYSYIAELKEKLSVEDAALKGIMALSFDGFHTSETYIDNINYQLRLAESLNVMEKNVKAPDAFMKETLQLAERNTLYIDKGLLQGLNVHKAFKPHDGDFRRAFKEKADIGSIHIALPHKRFMSGIGTKEKRWNCFEENVSEGLASGEKLRHQAEVQRCMAEKLDIAPILPKEISVLKRDSLHTNGDLLRNPRAVISDIVISVGEVNADVPAGYSEFRPFVPGDYAYQKALFRVTARTTSAGRRALIEDFSVNVDMPDLMESGTTEVGAEGCTVYFARRFFRVPDVTITMRAGTGSVPQPVIEEVTRDYFKVRLLGKDSVPASGRISWSALGC